jgi:hypothetical protein
MIAIEYQMLDLLLRLSVCSQTAAFPAMFGW